MFLRLVTILTISSTMFWSCSDNIDKAEDQHKLTRDYNYEVVEKWSHLYLEVEKDLAGFRPASTSRALNYIYLSAYQVGQHGMPRYKNLQDAIGIPGLPSLSKSQEIDYQIAINASMRHMFHEMLFGMNQDQKEVVESLYRELKTQYSANVDEEIETASESWGNDVAKAMVNYAKSDLEAEKQIMDPRPIAYLPSVGPGLWQPTAPDFSKALFPFWKETRRFAISEADMEGISPPPFDTNQNSQYYKEFKEVYDAVNRNLYKEVWIAEFWSDDIVGITFSPPARTFAIANQLIVKENMHLEETLHLYAKLGLATNDAAIAAWKNKYLYNVERPIDYIKKYIDPNWKPILGRAINNEGLSPAFPGYPSGHSTFAGVQDGILTEFFGANYAFTDKCHLGRSEFYGEPRTFLSFKEMAEENAYSRIYLGVHPRMDCEEGLRLGRIVAKKVNEIKFKI